ncbi:bifunctional phosphatase PAP2/diacylglycerol kinase family protein [Spongiactinospora sp. 9N601]|uniref:bifunctional phosphatase PAP2/diacylglycerol kinase family protein n=1 Tax=Spongiactinospora sp. 9N601 TaxID=3375149 RepID=UPI003795B667
MRTNRMIAAFSPGAALSAVPASRRGWVSRTRSRLGALDRRLFAAVAKADWPAGDQVLPALSRAADNSLLWAGFAAGLAVSGRRRLRRAATRGLLAVSLASPLVNLATKQAFGRRRPSGIELPLARLLAMPTSTSFPSGHSASAAAFATAVAMEAPPRVAVPVALVAAAVCFSRVYTGVHYPGDVLAGAGIGVATGLLTRRLWPDAAEAGRARAAATAPLLDLDPRGAGVVAVINPSSAETAQTADALRAGLPAADIVTPGPDADIAAVMREAAGRATVLAVAGGDGSASRAAAAALEHGRPLLVVPAGSFDHFARTLGIETPQEAVAAYRSGQAVTVDVGEAAGRVFLNNAGLGLYPALVDRREAREHRIGKWPALLWALGELLAGGARPVEVEVDGTPYRAWLLFVGNCRYDVRGAAPTRRARLEDGVLDIRLLAAAGRLPRLRAFTSVIGGRLGLSRHYHQWKADNLHVTTPSGKVRLACDGETFTARGPVTFAKRPRALAVLRDIG